MFQSLFGDIREEPMSRAEERATVLGYAGLVPFFLVLLMVWMTPSVFPLGQTIRFAGWGLIYGAIILSFMGGINWGVAIKESHGGRESTAVLDRLTGSVIPALIGWMTVIPDYLFSSATIPPFMRWLIMLVAFLYLLVADNNSVQRGELPRWYGQLRQKITFFLAMFLMLIIVRLWQVPGL